MENLGKRQGITLVALVVTIIVLLILAGVTLSLVAGSDGILNRATKAVDKNQIASVKERVDFKVAEDVEKFYEDKYVNRSVDNAMTVYEYLKANTSHQMKIGDEEYTITYIDSTDSNKPDDNTFQVNYVKKGTKLDLTGKITQKGVIIWEGEVEIPGGSGTEEGSGEVNITDMGKYVDLGTNLLDRTIALADGTTPETDWRILCREAENVWLIMSNCLAYEKNNLVGTALINNNSTTFVWKDYNWQSSTNSEHLITELKDEAKWKKLLPTNLQNNANVKVMGALDLEKWVEVWNAAEEKQIVTRYVEDGKSSGYLFSEESDGWNREDLVTLGNSNALFFPHRGVGLERIDYYLSSPGYGENLYYIIAINSYGFIGYDRYRQDNAGVRPVVCLPTSLLVEGENGIWKVE